MSELDINEEVSAQPGLSPEPAEEAAPEAAEELKAEEQISAEAEAEVEPAEEIKAEAEPQEEAAEAVVEEPTKPEPPAETSYSRPEQPAQSAAGSYTSPSYNQYNQYAQGGYPPQNGYQQQYGAPSQGYYRPESNEYVYGAQPPKKKKNGGKAFLIAVVCLLSVFVIAVASVSAYNFYTLHSSGSPFRNPFADSSGRNPATEPPEIDDHRNDDDEEQYVEEGPEEDDDEDDRAENETTASAPTAIRDFPTLEQLAAPEDAMSIPDIYDKVSPSVVGVSCSVRGGTQTGTGFVISEDGYIVTNAHVIENYLSVMIVDGDLNEYEAEVIGADELTDIAVLKADLDGKDLIPVEFGISSELRIGELAIAIGNPLGFGLYGTMTTGIISGLDRTVTVEDNTMKLLQTSATINNGNSGGPLIDAYGRVIGITSAKVDTMYGENLGFAIPIDEALPIIESLIKYGYVPGRPSLGITGQDITELMSIYYRMPKGVYVFAITPDSGAEKAGIVAGDIIIGIEGESITTSDELNDVKNRYSVGDTVTLSIYRSGQNFDVDVVLGESTPDEPQSQKG